MDHQRITKKNYIVVRGTQLNTSYSGCAPLLFIDVFLYKIIINWGNNNALYNDVIL